MNLKSLIDQLTFFKWEGTNWLGRKDLRISLKLTSSLKKKRRKLEKVGSSLPFEISIRMIYLGSQQVHWLRFLMHFVLSRRHQLLFVDLEAPDITHMKSFWNVGFKTSRLNSLLGITRSLLTTTRNLKIGWRDWRITRKETHSSEVTVILWNRVYPWKNALWCTRCWGSTDSFTLNNTETERKATSLSSQTKKFDLFGLKK